MSGKGTGHSSCQACASPQATPRHKKSLRNPRSASFYHLPCICDMSGCDRALPLNRCSGNSQRQIVAHRQWSHTWLVPTHDMSAVTKVAN
jgi:hypothetical protein